MIAQTSSRIRCLVNIPRRVEVSIHPIFDTPRRAKALDILLFDRWNVNIVFFVMVYKSRR